ncbi:MAG: D-aminoacylase [Chloroflexota bacterium]
MFDLIIKNGTLIDGTRQPRFRADLGIQGDQIKAIGDLGDANAAQIIDVTQKIVTPGFVDVHTHSDTWLLKTPHLISKTTQGFTTEVIMADGISYAPVNQHTIHDWIYYLRALNGLRLEEYTGWESLADYMALLDGRTAQNVITHIPYANLRTMACGFGRAVPDDYQMRQIIEGVERGMDEGAVGLSTGMDYLAEWFATTDELVEACRPMAAQQGLYVTHIRYKKGLVEGVAEAVEIGKRAGVPVHISHLKGTNEQEVEDLLTYIDTVAVNEVDFSFDVYPYVPSSTMLNYLLPYEVWEDGPRQVLSHLADPNVRAKFAHGLQFSPPDAAHIAWLPGKENSHHQGKLLSDYAKDVNKTPADALCDLLIEENLAVLLVFLRGDDIYVEPSLAHETFMIGSDGIYHEDGAIHPRQYGSASKILGQYVREKKLFSLEEAIYKLSTFPSKRFGLTNRGLLQEGLLADVVVFDPETVADRATYQNPHQLSVGIEYVIVNGTPIIADSEPIDQVLPGRALKYHQAL